MKRLLNILAGETLETETQTRELEKVVERLSNNALRMDYVEYLARGCQIGSGAMESLHRSGSQCRTKLPGALWLQETSQAVFNIRMMQLVGKWNAFWSRSDLMNEVAAAFSAAGSHATGPVAGAAS